jgi:hypothetical protein
MLDVHLQFFPSVKLSIQLLFVYRLLFHKIPFAKQKEPIMSWMEHFDMEQKLSMHDCTLHLLHLNHGPNTYVVPIKLERPFFKDSLPEEFSLTPVTTHSS